MVGMVVMVGRAGMAVMPMGAVRLAVGEEVLVGPAEMGETGG
jgi:hypothetical protein